MLASASPRRIAFLADIGLAAQAVSPPATAEPDPLPAEAPSAYALRAAMAKAASLASRFLGEQAGGVLLAPPPGLQDGKTPLARTPSYSVSDTDISGVPDPGAGPVIIAADTIVVLQNRIMGKPETPSHALAMLRDLAGKTHEVITGCALLSPSSSRSFSVHTRVTMWQCPDALLLGYAQSGEPMDKAGAYAIQGAGAFLVERIEGSWSNVVGLPLAELIQALLAMKAIT